MPLKEVCFRDAHTVDFLVKYIELVNLIDAQSTELDHFNIHNPSLLSREINAIN